MFDIHVMREPRDITLASPDSKRADGRNLRSEASVHMSIGALTAKIGQVAQVCVLVFLVVATSYASLPW